MTSRRYFILATFLFVPSVFMSVVGIFTPHYTHPMMVLSFGLMITGTVLTFIGFQKAS